MFTGPGLGLQADHFVSTEAHQQKCLPAVLPQENQLSVIRTGRIQESHGRGGGPHIMTAPQGERSDPSNTREQRGGLSSEAALVNRTLTEDGFATWVSPFSFQWWFWKLHQGLHRIVLTWTVLLNFVLWTVWSVTSFSLILLYLHPRHFPLNSGKEKTVKRWESCTFLFSPFMLVEDGILSKLIL